MSQNESSARPARVAGQAGSGPTDPPPEVRDVDGRTWEVRDELGGGGQGTVYRTQDPRFAVKLARIGGAALARDADQLDRARRRDAERLALLHILPLDGLPISRPRVRLIPPDVGYVMDLLDGLVPLRDLVFPPADVGDGLEDWYRATGGLHRRLRVLARTAEVLAEMHGRGIVYGDLSPSNVLVSADRRHHEVWLVDADNLAFESDLLAPSVGTPLFAAPEVVREVGATTPYTDAFSLAVLVFHTLVGEHPLIGDLAAESPELEADAHRGLLPWSGHCTDDRNHSTFGMDRRAVVHPKLKALFEQTFEEGLLDPLRRVSARTWATALHAAADRTVECRACLGTFYAYAPRCLWCGQARPPLLLVAVCVHLDAGLAGPADRDALVDTGERLVVQPDGRTRITARTTYPLAEDPWAAAVDLYWDGGDELRVVNLAHGTLRLASPGERGLLLPPGGELTTRVDKPGAASVLHLADGSFHRVLAFDPAS